MITIHTRRAGLVVIASTVTATIGLTTRAAVQRLHRRLDREAAQ